MKKATNKSIAAKFDEVALLLEEQGANPFRIASYRRGADTLRGLSKPAAEILEEEGTDGLEKLPGIGEGLSRAISIIVETGHLPLLDQLRGDNKPRKALMTLPGIGPNLAQKLQDELDIDSLEDLEAAVHDGRLEKIEGFGKKRVAAIRDVLAHRLRRSRTTNPSAQRVPVDELLKIDQEYRKKAKAGKLYKIAPRRFNPKREAWLPVLHKRRGDLEYTALFSNTQRAHELNMTEDWVVIYSESMDSNGASRQQTATVVTAPRGKLKGKRVVRGREEESAAFYEHKNDQKQ